MLYRRFGRPGLLGLAARTAVVAGTASAVGGAMRNRQQRAADERASADAWDAEQTVPMAPPAPAQAPPAPPVAPAPAEPDLMTELERLGQLKQQGLLSDDEFAAAKQRLISG
ncbi:putative oligomerization/nucleic acid binding protein [Curtobacterium sp. PhB130]|uniref:SHOCT domain-containing protein n=1 Tax=Curtobacterium sp. PhB130 TaxID=2485178 RepID=UPI000F4C8D99|nr:SHOCT domain-containing protein [Curtobacterium sp. PhB130]ROS73855.1 putative oligomerization/nucleic acid binding protein [Curtobacterium sp. PhB130]